MFEDYLRDLQRVVLLEPVEEAALWQAYRRDGDVESRLRLIEAYQPLVFKVVMGLRPPDFLTMDLIQEGAVGLIESVERFDPDRGVRFSTFATYRIRGRVLNALDRIRAEVSLDQGLLDSEEVAPLAAVADPAADAVLAAIEDRAVLAQALRLIDQLPARERAVLRALAAAHPPRRIADELRISLSHFYRLQKQATARLRSLLGLDAMHQPQRASGY
jgi:RNA polymerase sporulation-specific sigma factor